MKNSIFYKIYHFNEIYQSVHSHKVAEMLRNVGGK